MDGHTEHVTISNAYPSNCLEGECGHRDEDGQPEDMSVCPTVPPFEVCVDCMEAATFGRDPRYWDDVPLSEWPHPPIPEPVEPDPTWFKPADHGACDGTTPGWECLCSCHTTDQPIGGRDD